MTFEFAEQGVKLEEIYSFDYKVVRHWVLLYEGTVDEQGQRNFLVEYDKEFALSRQRMIDLSMIFISIMNFIVHYKEDREYIEVRKTTTKKPNKKKNNRPKKNVRYIPSRNYIINRVPSEEEVIQERKKRERHTEAWRVRGHYRRYKSGKVVWVRPYIKGDKSKLQPSEYKVRDFTLDA